jgi:hypothetical protein
MASGAELEHRFGFHPANTIQRGNQHDAARAACLTLAQELNALIPDDRPDEKERALVKVEEAMFWANAAIARQGTPEGIEKEI